MQFCQPHWDKLRAALDARGLTQFIAQGGVAAAVRMKAQLEQGQRGQEQTRESFEPLLNASFAIYNNAMSATPAGLALLHPNDDGTPRCPLCYINGERHKAAQADPDPMRWARRDDEAFYDEWIDKAADEQRDRAVALGLLGAA